MNHVVMGVGYTGRRVISLLPADRCLGIDRALLDLDSNAPASLGAVDLALGQ